MTTGYGHHSAPERKRGSGVKMVYDLLRDEILDLVLRRAVPIDECSLPNGSRCRARRSVKRWYGWRERG